MRQVIFKCPKYHRVAQNPVITTRKTSLIYNIHIAGMKLPRYSRSSARPRSLDFERAIHEMRILSVTPWEILKDVQSHHRATGKWSRDDPAFPVLLSAILLISGFIWGYFIFESFEGMFKLTLYMYCIEFSAMGIVIPTIEFIGCNKLAEFGRSHQLVRRIEWSYFFDVHCNSFLFVGIYMYVVQFVLFAALTGGGWASVIVGNSLYFAAAMHYSLITLLGSSVLPIWTRVINVHRIAVGILSISIIVYIVSMAKKIPLSVVSLEAYFGTKIYR